ncbi:cytidylyltransferase family protein [Drepanopeziza brunnea f. sp. 'multigermtubi' MB_m1]|uniref:Cytidylyltransferase family protein n=1 Tax=Marssonina brunnea f. sp. multigermtubi (strain MB_m1) TaxID=1072389 RepID=K1WMY7_MARBU|nr:cytidylyltransferase family protein [Drepanopeziza brunnea f. sp. 'multigermtubi' MB_m1]EKD13677.1 cytidylyltransferase family protein [Drepanopeziza brunnea f. sp. 'multigermtubi' MB_m1]
MVETALNDPEQMIALFRQALGSFQSSKAAFRIVSSIPHRQQQQQQQQPSLPKMVYILDSSFNPPTLAHARIILSALKSSPGSPNPPRVLLLLAIQNADKAPKPASFEERLAMMQVFAEDVIDDITSSSQSKRGLQQHSCQVGIDIGLTKLPYFADKALHISPSEAYPLQDTEQVHLIGYDTLVRCLDTKYYPPAHTLAPLQPFLAKHKLRVTYRADDEWGDKAAQTKFLSDVGEGSLESLGGLREWVVDKRIEMVEGRKEGEEVISSTKVREAAKLRDEEKLGSLVTPGIRKWILTEGLYTE